MKYYKERIAANLDLYYKLENKKWYRHFSDGWCECGTRFIKDGFWCGCRKPVYEDLIPITEEEAFLEIL